MTPIIELKNINCWFSKRMGLLKKERHFHVLKDINLKINSGEIIAIVGESGCGKTTLGKIITGLIKPSQGEILFEGSPIYGFMNTQFNKFRESVQFIQQDSYAALNPTRTIYQSLYAPLAAHNKSLSKEKLNDRIDELMTSVGLSPSEQFLTKYPHQLSGGQRQRVLMARALTLNPRLIVADEPVSMIDVSLRLSILNLMSTLNQKFDIAFIYITHDLATAKYIANNQKIGVMYLGQIVELGNINQVLTSPKHPYTQALLSAVPIPDPLIAAKYIIIPIKGLGVGSLENRNSGCPFYQRCIYSKPDCETKAVEMQSIDGQEIRCRYYKEVKPWEMPQ